MPSVTPVRLMHGISQHVLHMDPDRTAFQTSQAPNMTINGIFKPKKEKEQNQGTGSIVPANSMIGYRDNGTIQTNGSGKDIQRTLPPTECVPTKHNQPRYSYASRLTQQPDATQTRC